MQFGDMATYRLPVDLVVASILMSYLQVTVLHSVPSCCETVTLHVNNIV